MELIDLLAGELERPRQLAPQVLRYIGAAYGIEPEGAGAFLADELGGLGDDEVDLVLSPLFTPRLADQAVVAGLLGSESIPKDRWPALVRRLADRPVRSAIAAPDGTREVLLRDVIIERFVYRLRLDGRISAEIAGTIGRIPAEHGGPLLKAVARRAIWEERGRASILEKFLDATAGGDFRIRDAVDLLNLVESYKPSGTADLLARIPPWKESLRHDIDTAGGRAFLSSHAEYMHGGDRDHRSLDSDRISEKREELAFLERIERVFVLGST